MSDRWPGAMNISTVAEYLDCCVASAHKIVKDLGIPAVQLTIRGDRKYLKTDVDAFLDRQKDQAVKSRKSA